MSKLRMTRGLLFATLALALCMPSACSRPETVRTVSDTCLTMKIVRFNPAPAPGVDDPGNLFDSDETVADLAAQNAVLRRQCGTGSR